MGILIYRQYSILLFCSYDDYIHLTDWLDKCSDRSAYINDYKSCYEYKNMHIYVSCRDNGVDDIIIKYRIDKFVRVNDRKYMRQSSNYDNDNRYSVEEIMSVVNNYIDIYTSQYAQYVIGRTVNPLVVIRSKTDKYSLDKLLTYIDDQ